MNGLPSDQFEISESALEHIASRYTREAGVRTLERQIGSVIRHKTVQWADAYEGTSGSAIGSTGCPTPYVKVVDVIDLQAILGLEWYHPEEREAVGKRGNVNGLVVQTEGEGGILSVESLLVPGTGRLRLTGSLGSVLKESGELALSWVSTRHCHVR
jgi:ATP-dependent Lon protease